MTETSRLQPIANYLNTQFEHINTVSKDYKSALKNAKEIFAYTEELHNTMKQITELPKSYKERISEPERRQLRAEQDTIMNKLKKMQIDMEKREQMVMHPEMTTLENKNVTDNTNNEESASSASNENEENTNTSVLNATSDKSPSSIIQKPQTETRKTKTSLIHKLAEWSDSEQDVTADIDQLSSSTLPDSSETSPSPSIKEINPEIDAIKNTLDKNTLEKNDTSDSTFESHNGLNKRSFADSDSSSRLSRLESILNTDSSSNQEDNNQEDKNRRVRKDKIQLQKNDTAFIDAHALQDNTLLTPSIVNQKDSSQRLQKISKQVSPAQKVSAITPAQFTLLSLPSHITDAQKRRGKIAAKIIRKNTKA